MKNIISIGASNSKNSINRSFAFHAARQIDGANATRVDLNDFPLPIYGVDREEAEGIPENATILNDIIVATDGIVLSLAEHNGSFTSVFKNTIDWISRIDPKLWKNKPMLLLATSPGGRGGASVLNTALEIFPHLGANIIASFSLPSFYDNFSDGRITDEELNQDLNKKIELFSETL